MLRFNSRPGRIPVLAMLTAALLMVLCIGAVEAKKKHKKHKVASQVTIAITGGSGQFLDFAGAVTSPNAKCVGSRQVELLFTSSSSGVVSHVANPTTDSSGNWSMPHVGHHGGAGTYGANVGQVSRGKTICKAAQATIPFP